MRYNELFENKIDEEIINEIRARTKYNANDEESLIIAYRGDIWVIPLHLEEEDLDLIVDDINEKLKIDLGYIETVYDIQQQVEEHIPAALVGIFHDGVLNIQSDNELSHSPKSSPLVKQVMKYLDAYEVIINSVSYRSGEPVSDKTYRSEAKGELVGKFYHGTTYENLKSIIKKGLMPSPDKTNWQDELRFDDRVFVTNRFATSSFHANRAALNNKTIPVVIEFKDLPDKAKVSLDFDIANFYAGDDELDDEGYSDRIDSLGWRERNREKNNKAVSGSDINKMTGVISYKGRIPASHISAIFLPTDFDEPEIANKEDCYVLTTKDELKKAIEMIDEFGFYDPYYEPEDFEDEDELEK